MMKKVTLWGKTRIGRNRIALHGEVWEAVRESDVRFLLEAADCECQSCDRGPDRRWVSKNINGEGDPDFEILAVREMEDWK